MSRVCRHLSSILYRQMWIWKLFLVETIPSDVWKKVNDLNTTGDKMNFLCISWWEIGRALCLSCNLWKPNGLFLLFSALLQRKSLPKVVVHFLLQRLASGLSFLITGLHYVPLICVIEFSLRTLFPDHWITLFLICVVHFSLRTLFPDHWITLFLICVVHFSLRTLFPDHWITLL